MSELAFRLKSFLLKPEGNVLLSEVLSTQEVRL
jgi:hypothetical protein